MNSQIGLIIAYSISTVIMGFFLVTSYIKKKRITAILFVRAMYVFIYTIVPLVTHYMVLVNGKDHKTYTLDYSMIGMDRLFIMYLFSFAGLIALELGYQSKRKIVIGQSKPKRPINDSSLRSAAIIMVILSEISLFLWTKPFGGPIKFFQYGSLIRSGQTIDGISNTFGFMKKLVPLSQFASLIFVALFHKYRRFTDFAFFVPAMVVSIIYLIANDGRAPFLMFLISVVMLILLLRSKENTVMIRIKIWPLLLVFVGGLMLISTLEGFMNYAKTGVQMEVATEESASPLNVVYSEFSWTVRNAQAVQEAMEQKEDTWLIGREILSGMVSLFPSRFRPNSLPRLEKTNTLYWVRGGTVYGGKPPDILCTGLYLLSYLGIFILPYVYGRIVKRLDTYFSRSGNGLYYRILFVQMIYQVMKTIAYCDFALIVLNLFYIIVGHFIIRFCNRYLVA